MAESNERERAARESVHSLISHCMDSPRPVLTLSRACSKVSYLAGDGVRDNLFHVASALNEQKHAALMKGLGDPGASRQHSNACVQELLSFMRGVRRELHNPPEVLPTAALTERIQRNLQNGQWVRAEKDLGDLATRSDQQSRLPRLDTYSRSELLRVETFEHLDKLIEHCNGKVRAIDPSRDAPVPGERSSAEPSLHGRASAAPLPRHAQPSRGLDR